MTDVLALQNQLQKEAKLLLSSTAILAFLNRMGEPIQTGSSVTGLMVYPDIDFAVQNDDFDIEDAISMAPSFFRELKVTTLKIADFKHDTNEGAGYYVGFELLFNSRTWHVDATITKRGPIGTDPPELAGWIANMGQESRITILKLKKELIDAGRYVGSRSKPPYTFRSAHLYEAVIKGGAKTVDDLEDYFKRQI